jgi:hypothetical protein
VSGIRPDFHRLRGLVTVRTFLSLLGLVYFVAFASLGSQALGLIGSHGILPLGNFLAAVREAHVEWEVPSVFWLSSGDRAITAVWVSGAVASLVAIITRYQRAALAVCLVLWLSLCAVGQDFLSFQWDVLLAEAGFLALFPNVWLYRWLLFRLMFYSGAVKLLSQDATWRNLTALHFHYETQPLPTPLAWYMYQLPMWFQKASTVFVFVAELAVPFLFFFPRGIRRWAAWVTIALQVLILLTGNYTFFNWLAILLTMWLFIEPQRGGGVRMWIPAVVVAPVSILLTLQLFSLPLPPGGAAMLHFMEPLRIVNSYGLFANMTTTRPEIIVEGSNDGVTWRAYEFRYKPGDVFRAPPWVAPHQPRLDWQMWFAALGSYQQNRWFTNFMARLLQGEPAVLRLLESNPFPTSPPKYVRARVYLYHFTSWGERAWWRREDRGAYFPAVSLK